MKTIGENFSTFTVKKEEVIFYHDTRFCSFHHRRCWIVKDQGEELDLVLYTNRADDCIYLERTPHLDVNVNRGFWDYLNGVNHEKFLEKFFF